VHALQVGLVDAREGLDDDGAAAQVARLQGGVLPGGALPVVIVADHHPRLARRLQCGPIWCECMCCHHGVAPSTCRMKLKGP
jgi:hypothetical protein